VDLSKAGAKSGDQGVLQALYTNGMNISWYQCADIMVVDAKKSSGASYTIGTSGVALSILISFFMTFF
jgi:hypothetical protein